MGPRTRALVFTLLLVAACKRESTATTNNDGAAEVIASSTPSASASASTTETNPFKALALRWTRALNAHDDAELRAVHAPMVKFYGSNIDNATYVTRIDRALAKDSSFHQTLVFTNVEWRNRISVKVSFRKEDGKRITPAYIVIERQYGRPNDGQWLISEESDVASDAIPPTCYAYGATVSLTGIVEDTEYIVHDTVWPCQLLHLERAICTREGEDKELEPRVDSIETLHLREGPKQPTGKHTITGLLHHQDGSPYYATEVAMAMGAD